jgi:hypothetical protein
MLPYTSQLHDREGVRGRGFGWWVWGVDWGVGGRGRLLPSGTQENINKYIIKPAVVHGSRRKTGFCRKINVSCEKNIFLLQSHEAAH